MFSGPMPILVPMENPIANCLPFFFLTDLFHQPMLPHISIEAPTIRNAKKFGTIKGKQLGKKVKVYYWFISKGVNFDA